MYKKNKKIEKRKVVFISLFLLCLILGFIANVVTTNRNLTIFEKAIKDSILSIEKVLMMPFDFIGNKINENKEKNKMYDEYKNLQKKLEESDFLISKNDELKKELEELKNSLDINKLLSDYVYTNATVINRDLSYWNDTITIDKGEYDGISKEMPVIVKNGLIGKVISTTTFTSTIRLLKASSSDRISVKIKNDEEYVYGILTKYNQDKDTYIIEGISQNIDIKNGVTVTTTGMGDTFPSGIVIGKITGISTDNFDLAKVLEMKSDVNFDNINYVTVLKRNDKK